MPGFPQRARADGARAAPRRDFRRVPDGCGWTGGGHRPSRVALRAGDRSRAGRTIGRRSSGRPADACAAGEDRGSGCPWCSWTCLSIRARSASSRRRWSRARPRLSRRFPTATSPRATRSVAWRRLSSRPPIPHRRETDLAHLRRYVFTIDRAARARSARATCGCSRRRAKAARRSRSCGVCSTRRHAACRSTRWRCSCARRSSTSACSSTRARVAASRRISIAARGGPIRPGRAFVALLSCAVEGLSAKRFDEYLSLGQVPSLSRPPARRRAARRVAAG